MKKIIDNNSEYVQCENSNLRFHGTKLDRNGNECAVFSTPNHNAFSIQRNSLWGTQSWNTGSKSTMDAETFLEKNPKVTLESLERDVIKLANQTKAAWGKNIRVHNKQILDSRRVKDDDSSQKGLIEDFSSWASAERCPLTPYHFKGFRENDPSFNSNAAFDIIDELVKWNGFILEDLNDLVVAKFDTHDNAAVEECCEDIKLRVGNALSRVDRYFNDKNYIVQLYIKALERAHRLAVNELKSLNTVSDSRKVKDAETRKAYLGTIPTGRYFNLQGKDWRVIENKRGGDTVVCEMIGSGEIKEFNTVTMVNLYNSISDSRKIKDANDTPDVLDGVLFVAFEDGTEDEMIAEVNKHKNESGKIDGVQYETYGTDSQDGVAMIDLCAMTGDANGFVKALLNEWGVTENVIDLEFQASDEMKEAVSDSRRVKDYKSPLDVIENAFNSVANELGTEHLSPKFYEKVNEYIKTYPVAQGGNSCTIVYQGAEYNVSYDFRDNRFYATKDEWNLSEAIEKRRKLLGVSDSRKVNDMTKPARLRGYAEKVRANRRKKNDEQDDEKENEKQDVADSRRVKDDYGTVAYFTTIGKNKYGEDRYHVEIVNKFDKGDFVVDEFDVDNYTDGFITVKGLVWKIYINGRPIWEN